MHAAVVPWTLAACMAAGPPDLSTFRTKFEPVVACPSKSSTPCPGFEHPQLAGRVPGDNATLCWHLGCCWTTSGLCVIPTIAQGLDDDQELWAGNQPIPALSNTRGSLQIPLESGDALAVDCVYFPPFFSTCDGSRSDSRNDRPSHSPTSPVDATPTFDGVVQNTRVDGHPVRVLQASWSPFEIVRRATNLDNTLDITSAVRMPFAESAALLRLNVSALDNSVTSGGSRTVNVSTELPWISRLYDEVEGEFAGQWQALGFYRQTITMRTRNPGTSLTLDIKITYRITYPS